MQPQQPNYDFIMNPSQPSRSSGSPMAMRFLVIVGIVFVMVVLFGLIFRMVGTNPNFSKSAMLGIAQDQTELIRLTSIGSENSTSQKLKNFSITARMSLTTDQQALLSYLADYGYKPSAKDLPLKQDPSIDTQLNAAVSSSTFDVTYDGIMERALENYMTSLSDAYDSSGESAQKVLKTNYAHAALLRKQLEGEL